MVAAMLKHPVKGFRAVRNVSDPYLWDLIDPKGSVQIAQESWHVVDSVLCAMIRQSEGVHHNTEADEVAAQILDAFA